MGSLCDSSDWGAHGKRTSAPVRGATTRVPDRRGRTAVAGNARAGFGRQEGLGSLARFTGSLPWNREPGLPPVIARTTELKHRPARGRAAAAGTVSRCIGSCSPIRTRRCVGHCPSGGPCPPLAGRARGSSRAITAARPIGTGLTVHGELAVEYHALVPPLVIARTTGLKHRPARGRAAAAGSVSRCIGSCSGIRAVAAPGCGAWGPCAVCPDGGIAVAAEPTMRRQGSPRRHKEAGCVGEAGAFP
jgi:hypothetical protein